MLLPLQVVLAAALILSSMGAISDAITKSDVVADSIDGEFEETELSPADFDAARQLREIDLKTIGIDVVGDPTLGSKAEGDIALSDIKSFVKDSNTLGRNAIRQFYRRWPDGIIPYTLSGAYGSYSKRVIARAMEEYHMKTCIKFVPRDPTLHRDYIYIHPDDGCYSLVGRTGGRQPLSLDAGCIQVGTIVHELMHTVGFFHEQSRADRDDFIEIVMANVMKGADDQFDKYSLRVIDHLEEPYDYNSIMHYGPYAFSGNGAKTILPKQQGASKMGQRIGFSDIDLRKIRKLYNCDADSALPTAPTAGGVVVDENGGEDENSIVVALCVDENWRCSFWSMGVFGYCDKYEDVRNKVCRKSCGTCDQQQQRPTAGRRVVPTASLTLPTQPTQAAVACKDFNPACVRWSIKGHCTRSGYESFMSEQCPVSCRTCPPQSQQLPQRATATSECIDNPSYKVRCEVVKLFGRCDSPNSREMVQNYCRKTCGLCTA
uniref:Metalloendopeptidase n=1 Tax=Plectus sambesii TaxID=2011161 RepID=A0A914W6A0_9BILA